MDLFFSVLIFLTNRELVVLIQLFPLKPHSGKSATIQESDHGLGVCKEHYA